MDENTFYQFGEDNYRNLHFPDGLLLEEIVDHYRSHENFNLRLVLLSGPIISICRQNYWPVLEIAQLIRINGTLKISRLPIFEGADEYGLAFISFTELEDFLDALQ